ncbi:unnamed protein product [Lupinus luteus]|uniref:GDSL esterase/lipase n=1 Tax=Lupinus luteus TaxID=3873 RepID=A0AAV1WQ12_LUPLU
MGNRDMLGSSFLFILFFIFNLAFLEAQVAQVPPAMFVFGDSLVDVGNNNYLSLSVQKATFPHNGIDFLTKKPTGRFSNGKNTADFIAEKFGLPTSPPYLSLTSKVKNKEKVLFMDGVNFASGGAGILGGMCDLKGQSISLRKQVDYYSQVHQQMMQQIGAPTLEKHLSKSIFLVVIGSNDIFGYFNSKDLQHKSTPQQYADSMAASLRVHLQRVYNFGARIFVIAGVGALGCCPAIRLRNVESVQETNLLAVRYNDVLKKMLKEWHLQNKGVSYTYLDTYSTIQDMLQNPTSYGFTELKAACCGLGNLNAQVPCLPCSNVCSNRQDHIFWDLYHPTEAAARIFVDKSFHGL